MNDIFKAEHAGKRQNNPLCMRKMLIYSKNGETSVHFGRALFPFPSPFNHSCCNQNGMVDFPRWRKWKNLIKRCIIMKKERKNNWKIQFASSILSSFFSSEGPLNEEAADFRLKKVTNFTRELWQGAGLPLLPKVNALRVFRLLSKTKQLLIFALFSHWFSQCRLLLNQACPQNPGFHGINVSYCIFTLSSPRQRNE